MADTDKNTVLAVNDEPDHLHLMSTLLNGAGYHVLTASDGCKAFDLAQHNHPHLVISDVAMPCMDGIELCRRIRAETELQIIPILLVSAHRRDAASAIEGLEAGADEYLEAPYEPMRLIAHAARLVERSRSEAALHEADQRAVKEYERLLNRIASLALALGRARELTVIFRAVLEFALASTPCDGLLISLYNAEKQERRLAFVWSKDEEIDLSLLPAIPKMSGPQRRAVETGKAVFTDDYQAAVAGLKIVKAGRDPRVARSSLAVPMSVMGKIVGAIEVQSFELADFRGEHATAMEMAANLAANAIENVRLLEREHEQGEQLRQSQKLEGIGRLAGGIAHDFNNLLTAINGYSDLMLRRLCEGDPLRRNAEEIRKAGERAASLTRQLLAFSRKQVLQPLVLDLNAVVADMDKLLRRLIGEDIDLVTSLEPKLGRVKADPGQIEQVVMNLAVNARDAMPRGGHLTIETRNVYLDKTYAHSHVSVHPGRYVMLAVSDTGIGIDAKIREHIFEPFFTTKEAGKGTGLGLSMVYGIVKQSGGNIWVYSEPGHGTAFKIYLPQIEEEASTESSVIASEVVRGTETILLVEDEERLRELIREILEMEGYTVLAASNGHEALSICEQHEGTIDLLITDVVMPEMSGRELAESLEHNCSDVKVLFMSGYTDDAIVRHGVLEASAFFLQKPFTPDALSRKVREVLNR
jgi:two-component system, cell cycle sensor histidine kinase and response regulator CckA